MSVHEIIPVHERKILEAHVRKVPLSQLAVETSPLDEYQREELQNLVRMRLQGLPLQYLIGNQSFYGREFYITTCVLIPRPETEGLVELALKHLPAAEPGVKLRGIDFGVGSGCISLTLCLERPDLAMIGVDCSEEALDVVFENARKFRVHQFDALKVFSTPDLADYAGLAPVNLLISNPPYLTEADEVAADVREHEPYEALFAPSEDPLYFYKFLAELADQKLLDGGIGVFEIAEQRGKETVKLFEEKGLTAQIFKDLAGRDRYLLVQKGESHG